MFHFERNWLIIGRTVEQMFNALSKQKTNVNAEVMVMAVCDQEKYSYHTRSIRVKH